MVKGIYKFKEYFADYVGQYVLIGGTACDIILGKNNISFRATKDLDIVLVMELLNEEFVNRFIEFIEAGGYQHINKGTGENQFYRFELPTDSSFPFMIELFSKRPDYLMTLEQRLAPIHISDDTISLSAILLDDDYYQLLKEGPVQVNGVSVLNIEYLILFKIKAWLDLSLRKAIGEHVDNKNIKKHKNDIIRLAANLNPDTTLEISENVRNDVIHFVDQMEHEKVNMKNLGLVNVSYFRVMERLKRCYGI